VRVLMAGTRSITDPAILEAAIRDSRFEITEVVCSDAPGVDALASVWAKANKVPVTRFKERWTRYGRASGAFRNQNMHEYADALLAVWDGQSIATGNVIKMAESRGLKVFVYLHKLSGEPHV